MLVRPEPLVVVATSKPAPSSLTLNCSVTVLLGSRTTAPDACAYFCTFCSASSTEKYTAASTSCE